MASKVAEHIGVQVEKLDTKIAGYISGVLAGENSTNFHEKINFIKFTLSDW